MALKDWLFQTKRSQPDLLMGLCVGGDEDGKLIPQTNPHFICFSQSITSIYSGVELPKLEEVYKLEHFAAPDCFYHLWYVDNGDSKEAKQKEGLRVLLDATASERSAVRCKSVNDCQLTSPPEVVR